jgi:hypothetical protein
VLVATLTYMAAVEQDMRTQLEMVLLAVAVEHSLAVVPDTVAIQLLAKPAMVHLEQVVQVVELMTELPPAAQENLEQ